MEWKLDSLLYSEMESTLECTRWFSRDYTQSSDVSGGEKTENKANHWINEM